MRDELVELAGWLVAAQAAADGIIIYDETLMTQEGHEQIAAIRDHSSDRVLVTMAIPVGWLSELSIFAAPDQLAFYRQGWPILIMGVRREHVEPRPPGDRHDAELVKTAKTALANETFRLFGRQSGVEIGRNSRARNLTEREAEHRARQTLGVAGWRGNDVPSFDTIMQFVSGLIDRGRRVAAKFYGVAFPRNLIAREKADVLARKAERGAAILDTIEYDNISRARGMAWNEDQAGIVTKAMEAWNKLFAEQKPIDSKWGERLTNAFAERMSAPALMRVAISGDIQPTDIHKNLLIDAPRFEIGRLIGRLSRGHEIALDANGAKILRRAIDAFARGVIATQSDSSDILLADAAQTCHDISFWMEALDRIQATGSAETILPKTRAA